MWISSPFLASLSLVLSPVPGGSDLPKLSPRVVGGLAEYTRALSNFQPAGDWVLSGRGTGGVGLTLTPDGRFSFRFAEGSSSGLYRLDGGNIHLDYTNVDGLDLAKPLQLKVPIDPVGDRLDVAGRLYEREGGALKGIDQTFDPTGEWRIEGRTPSDAVLQISKDGKFQFRMSIGTSEGTYKVEPSGVVLTYLAVDGAEVSQPFTLVIHMGADRDHLIVDKRPFVRSRKA